MKIKARKIIPLEVKTKVDFPVGNLIHVETGKINFTIKEKGETLVLELEKPYVVTRKNSKELVIESKTIKTKKSKKEIERLEKLRKFINWSEVSRLLVGNASTITRGHTPRKHQANIDELLKVVNEWIAKQT